MRSNARQIDLVAHRLAARQRSGDQENPVTRHHQLQLGAVSARGRFGGGCNHRGHTRMRHLCFDSQRRAVDAAPRGIQNMEFEDRRADRRWCGGQRPTRRSQPAICSDYRRRRRNQEGKPPAASDRCGEIAAAQECSGGVCHGTVPRARALVPSSLRRREHVVVHRDDHRDEDDGVVEQVQFDARHPQLHEAGRHRPPERNCVRSAPVRREARVRCGERTGSRGRWSTTGAHRPVKPGRSSHKPMSITTAYP